MKMNYLNIYMRNVSMRTLRHPQRGELESDAPT